MISVTADFLAALRAGHSLIVRATVSAPGGGTIDVPIEDGTITVDRTAATRRQLDLTISDPTYYPESPTDLVGVWGSEVQVWRGIRYGDGSEEIVSEGVYRIDTLERDVPGGGVKVTGLDRSIQVAETQFTKPRKFAATDAIVLITQLIQEVYPGAAIDSSGASTTATIPKHTVPQDRWGEIARVSQVIGCETFADENGDWVIQDIPDPTVLSPVWTVDAGTAGVLVSAQDTSTREGAANGAVVTGESANGNQNPVYSLATDNDPLSPTLWGGPYGMIPDFFSSPHIKTQTQANRVSAARLAELLGVSRSVDFTAVPNPALDAGDVITIIYPDGSTETHIIDSLTIPLTPDGDMTGNTRVTSWGA